MPIVPINEDERAASAAKLGLTNALPGIDSIPISANQASPGAQNIVGQDDPAKYVIPQVSVDEVPKPSEPSAPSFLDDIPDLGAPTDSRQVATAAPDFLTDIPDVQTKTEQAYTEASQHDPARNAKVLKYSQQFGQPPEFIDKNLDHAEKMADAPHPSFYQEMESQYPGSTKFYQKPGMMDVAHDDLKNVVAHEGLVKKVTEAHGLWDSFKLGLEGSVAGDFITGGKPSMEQPKDQSTTEWLAQQAGTIIPDLPVMGVGALAGGLAGTAVTPGAGTIIGAGAGGFGAPTGVHEVLKQYRKGEIKDFKDAVSRIWEIEKQTGKSMAIGAATGAAAIATAGMGPLAALTAEIGTMTAAGKMAEEGSINPNDLLDYISGNDVGKDVAQNTLLIGGMHAVGALPGKAKEHVVAEQKTRAAKDFYTSLGNTAEASKLRERLPEAHRELVADLVKDTPVEHIYLPVEEATTYFQGKGVKIDDVVDQMGIRQAYEEAKATGGDIKIPLSTWVDKVVGTEHYKGLENDIKFHPEDLSNNQATSIRSEITAQVQEAAKQASETAPIPEVENQAQATEAAGKIYQDLQVKLKAAGLSENEVRYDPKLHEAFFTTIAKRINESMPADTQIDPYELQQKFPLEVRKFDSIKERDASRPVGSNEKEAAQNQSFDQSMAWKKEGYKIEHTDIPSKSGDFGKGGYILRALAPDGTEVGSAEIHVQDKKTLFPRDISVDPEHQRKGLASAMYNYAEKISKKEIRPSGDQTRDAQGMWSDPDRSFGNKLLDQKGDENTPRGQIRINGREFNIDLFKKDKSTFLHESGHFFLEVMGHVVEGEGKGSEQIQKDYAAILKFLDVRSREDIKVDQHEKFARAFEEYLASGEAPSLQLRDAFYRFRKWLTDLWKKVSFSKVEVSPEMKEVFDRMMAADDEIAKARRHLNMEEEFKIDGEDPTSAKQRKDLQEKARARAEETLLKDKLKETKSEYREKLAAEREKFRSVAEEQVNNEPVFQAVENLRESGSDPYELANQALRGELTPEQSVQFELLADEHGFTTAEELAKAIADAGANNTFESTVNSIVDQNLRQVGMIKDAATLREDAIRAIHSEQMTELLALEREALSDLHTKAEITGEARRRNRIVAKVEAAAANAEAQRILSLKPASEAGRPQIYITMERNAAARVAKFMAKKEYDKAAKAKQEQMVAHSLVRESFKIGEEVEKHENYIKQFTNRGLSLMDMPYGFIRQVDGLLSRFGYQGARGEDGATQAKIAEMMDHDGRDPHEIANATGFVQSENGAWVPEALPQFVARQNDNYHAIMLADSVLQATQVDHAALTLPELRDLREAVETIVSSGRKNDRFLNEFIKVDAKAAAAELRASIEQKIGKPHEKDFEIGSGNEHGIGATLKSILNFPDAVIPSMVNMETLVNFLDRGDPNGPARRYLYRPMADAENRKQVRHDVAIKEMNAILEKHYKPEELATYKTEKRLAVKGFPDALTKENVLSMALNWGNETNRDRVRRGYKIDDNAVQAAFEVLDKRDWDFVQDSWNYLDSYWPEIKKLEMKVKGIEPRKVESSRVVTKFGVYDGGYYPIAYDHMKSAEAFQMGEQRSELYKQFSAVSAHTERGHAEARVNRVSRPVRLSLGVMFDHLENVIHDLSYRESVIDVNRMLRDYDVKGGVQNAVGLKGFRMMDQWLKDIASDQRGSLQDGEQLLKWFRMKATMSTLGFRAFTLPMDITGNIITAVHEIGPMRVMRAMGDHVFGKGEGKEFVEANSTYMEQRGKTMDRDLADLNRRWTLEKPVLDRVASKITGKDIGLRNFAFFFQRFADDAVAVPLWNEVYKHSLGSAEHRDAVHMADEAVKRTMGSGSHIDLVGVQKGSEKAKIMSMYYSWSSMMFNRAWSEGKIAGLEYREGNYLPALAVAARGAFFLWGLHAVNETFWRELMYNAQNGNANPDNRKKRIVGRILNQPFSYLWLGRDIAGLAIDKATGSTGSFRLSPVESAVEAVVSPPAKAVYFAFTDHKKFDQRFTEESARALALMAGSPQTLNSMAFNFIDWTNNQGQATWRDALSRRHKK